MLLIYRPHSDRRHMGISAFSGARCVIVLGRMRSGWELSEGSAVVHLDVLKVISSSNLVRASGVGGYIGQDWIRFIDYSTFVCCCE
jgi:hypothetical protein